MFTIFFENESSTPIYCCTKEMLIFVDVKIHIEKNESNFYITPTLNLLRGKKKHDLQNKLKPTHLYGVCLTYFDALSGEWNSVKVLRFESHNGLSPSWNFNNAFTKVVDLGYPLQDFRVVLGQIFNSPDRDMLCLTFFQSRSWPRSSIFP